MERKSVIDLAYEFFLNYENSTEPPAAFMTRELYAAGGVLAGFSAFIIGIFMLL